MDVPKLITVWIDFFADRTSEHVVALEDLIRNREDLCICGIVLTEVLQGIKSDTEFNKIKDLFSNLLFLPMPYSVFLKSANIYRHLRRKGITIRKSVDCMIASVAIEKTIPILHNDKDFNAIEKYCGLRGYLQ